MYSIVLCLGYYLIHSRLHFHDPNSFWMWNDTTSAPYPTGYISGNYEHCDTVPSYDNFSNFTIQIAVNQTLTYPFVSHPSRPWDEYLGSCNENTYCSPSYYQASDAAICLPKHLAGAPCNSTNQCFGTCHLKSGTCDGPTSYPAGFDPHAGPKSMDERDDSMWWLAAIFLIILPTCIIVFCCYFWWAFCLCRRRKSIAARLAAGGPFIQMKPLRKARVKHCDSNEVPPPYSEADVQENMAVLIREAEER